MELGFWRGYCACKRYSAPAAVELIYLKRANPERNCLRRGLDTAPTIRILPSSHYQ